MRNLESAVLLAVPKLVVFRATDIARRIDADPVAVARTLARLAKSDQVTRLTRGVWANTRHPRFSPYIAVPLLAGTATGASPCYVSYVSALSLHGMISQIPAAIHVAVLEQRRPVTTPVGTFRFHQMDRALFDGFAAGDSYGRFELAGPTKALFDTLYLAVRRGRRFSHLPEVDIPRVVTDVAMQTWIKRIAFPKLQAAVNARWQALRLTARNNAESEETAVARPRRGKSRQP